MGGEPCVGKTTFVSYVNFGMPRKSIAIGQNFIKKNLIIKGKSVRVHLWDLCGAEIIRIPPKALYRHSNGIILLYDITKKRTFENIPQWVKNVREFSNNKAFIMLIGSKCDLDQNREVPIEEGAEFSKSENLIFFEASSLKEINVFEAFTFLVTKIVENFINDAQNKKEEINNTCKEPNQKSNSICNLS